MFLFLHIGFEKTGSSAFQEAWFAMPEKDLIAAQFARHPSFMAPSSYGMTTLLCDEDHLGDLKRPPATLLPDLLDYLKCNADSHIQLSDEHISSRLLEPIQVYALSQLLRGAGHELVVLAVTREKDDWLRSKYAQAVKGGYYKSFKDYVSFGASRQTEELNIDRTLSLWRDSGARLIELQHSADVVPRLFKVLAETTGNEFPVFSSPPRANVRISSLKMRALIRLNKWMEFSPRLRKICRRIILKL